MEFIKLDPWTAPPSGFKRFTSYAGKALIATAKLGGAETTSPACDWATDVATRYDCKLSVMREVLAHAQAQEPRVTRVEFHFLDKKKSIVEFDGHQYLIWVDGLPIFEWRDGVVCNDPVALADSLC